MRKDLVGLFWNDSKPPKDDVKREPPPRTWEAPDYLPGLEEARAFKVNLFESWEEIKEASERGEVLVFDIEVYENLFLAIFTSFQSGKSIVFEMGVYFPIENIRWLFENFLTVGFNSESYDITLMRFALHGYTEEELKGVSDAIIVQQEKPWELTRAAKLPKFKVNHVDLLEVAPLDGSLKLYAGRLHVPRMQDLPFHPNTILSKDQKTIVRYYCINDTHNTCYLLKELSPQVELRAKMSSSYGVDLRSKSDAQVAETVINSEWCRRNGEQRAPRTEIPPGTRFFYKVPDFVAFKSETLQKVLSTVAASPFVVELSGYCQLPEAIAGLDIVHHGSRYKMGIGGLHSQETTVAHYADEEHRIFDRDVTSYYPSIILNQRLYPKHLGPSFLEIYRSIVEERKEAKKKKDKLRADVLKIVVNGSFGKFGNLWSTLYAPDLLIQTTISGQLCLLMLIEHLTEAGAVILSANTDGLIYKVHNSKQEAVNLAVKQWEERTQFETEETEYLGVFSRDVNNYIAVKTDRKTKVKGEYSERGSAQDSVLSKNPVNLICNDAVAAFLAKGTPISKTIRECQDPRRFVTVRTVKGGAVKDGEYLGKVIRYYYAIGAEGEIIYAMTGNKVPNSDKAKPLMNMGNKLPPDIDFGRYEVIAFDMLKDLGCQFN